MSASLRKGKTVAARFAGERIALYRGADGTVYALEDRCAHRQVPLSMGVVEGDTLRCCYHAWAYRGNGRICQIPYLPKGAARPPRGVRAYPAREAYGLVFVFPGDPGKAAATPLPELPEFGSARHMTMRFSRTVACHYSFLHENLLDMNHQFLHRGIVGRIQPEAARVPHRPAIGRGPVPVHPRGGKKSQVPGCSPPAPAAAIRRTSSPSAPATPTRPCSWHRRTLAPQRFRYGRPTCQKMLSSAPAMPTACS